LSKHIESNSSSGNSSGAWRANANALRAGSDWELAESVSDRFDRRETGTDITKYIDVCMGRTNQHPFSGTDYSPIIKTLKLLRIKLHEIK